MQYKKLTTHAELDAFFGDCETHTLAATAGELTPDELLGRITAAWTRLRDGLLSLVNDVYAWLAGLFPSIANTHSLTMFGNVDDSLMGEPSAAGLSLCDTWAKAKPLVALVLSIPFLPASWKAKIQPVLDLFDMLCPVSKGAA